MIILSANNQTMPWEKLKEIIKEPNNDQFILTSDAIGIKKS